MAVTLSIIAGGQSVGSIAVTLHMISPMSKGLFHRGIAMSGAGTSQIPLKTDQLDLAKKQAVLVNCATSNTQEMVKCLREVNSVFLIFYNVLQAYLLGSSIGTE